jgi:hypothetical protein
MEDDLNFIKMEDNLNVFPNGRLPHFLSKMEDNLSKIFTIILLLANNIGSK